MRLLLTASACLALGLGVAGCGEAPTKDAVAQDPASSSVTATPTPTPTRTVKPLQACAAVWREGRVLAEPYAGCTHAGKVVRSRPVICETGQRLYAYDQHFWAVGGFPVQRTDGPYRDDPGYQRAWRSCTG